MLKKELSTDDYFYIRKFSWESKYPLVRRKFWVERALALPVEMRHCVEWKWEHNGRKQISFLGVGIEVMLEMPHTTSMWIPTQAEYQFPGTVSTIRSAFGKMMGFYALSMDDIQALLLESYEVAFEPDSFERLSDTLLSLRLYHDATMDDLLPDVT